MRKNPTVPLDQDFLQWGRATINAGAARLEASVPDAKRGSESRLTGYESIYVHFRDQKVPGRIAVWLFAAEAGSGNSIGGYRDAIGVGIKRDPDVELVPSAWRFRNLRPFRWQTHVDERYAGYRWMNNADGLPTEPERAADVLADQIQKTLRAAEII